MERVTEQYNRLKDTYSELVDIKNSIPRKEKELLN